MLRHQNLILCILKPQTVIIKIKEEFNIVGLAFITPSHNLIKPPALSMAKPAQQISNEMMMLIHFML